jgi:phosphoribosylaminoimidazole-succinocarboxamide synthase
MKPAMLTTSIKSLPLLARGKVRDNYAVGDDRILMVATDRLSAFDVVMNQGVPGKGEVLTQMALFWFKRLEHIIPNHLTGEDPLSVVAPDERDQIRGRAMLVKRLQPLPIEAVVRGYLAGSAWKEYQETQSVCGVPLPAGLQKASKLPEPIFTPATKAGVGKHDENIDFARMTELISREMAETIRNVSIKLYSAANKYAFANGLIIADTKFEYGTDKSQSLILMDEILTPDSSRYWLMSRDTREIGLRAYDKQFLRDWLEESDNNGEIWNKRYPPPAIPQKMTHEIFEKYSLVMSMLDQ